MKYIRQFIADAGGYGVASVAAAFVSYGVAIWEHAHDKPLSAFLLLAITVPLFWIGSLVAWLKVRKELEDLKQQPESIEVRLRELYRIPKDKYTKSAFDLFLHVRLELKNKLESSALNYRFELSLNGLAEPVELKQDLGEWELTLWTPKADGAGILVHPLALLPSTLRVGEPIEGWLHFVTVPTTGELLERCAIRLVVQTAHGSSYKENEADPDIWNPRKEVNISRKIGGKSWSSN